MQGPSQLLTPLYSQLILPIYAAMNGLGGGAKTKFAPRAREILGTPLPGRRGLLLLRGGSGLYLLRVRDEKYFVRVIEC